MSDSDERRTPQRVYAPLNRLFHFTLDPCTTPNNTLLFFTKEVDGLAQSWAGQSVFVNPPYSQMKAWAQKACGEAAINQAFVAFLMPNDCSTTAWQWLDKAAWGKWFIPCRVKFETPDGRTVDVARSHCVFFLGGLE
jgi:phage N-6-adenine-methyltransferase